MNTVYPIIEPLLDAWDYYLHDPYMKDLEQFTAGSFGMDWNSKYVMSEQNKTMGKYHELQKRFSQPTEVSGVLEDNLTRLSILYGVERHLTIRQAFGGLKSRFSFGDTNTGSLQKMVGNGLFSGYFRGILLNTFQFVATQAHPLFYSRGTNYSTHYLYASLFEVATYPVDTIKTILQADVNRQYRGTLDCISKVYEQGGLSHFYKGLIFKLAFNGALIYHLRNIYEKDNMMAVSFPLLALSYIFLTFKTRLQITDTQLTFIKYKEVGKVVSSIFFQGGLLGLYRGLLPFLALNSFFHYNLYALYSPEAQKHTLDEIVKTNREIQSSSRNIKIWA